MYAAILHQINPKGSTSGVVQSVQQLRNMAADFMRSHPDDFMPFMDEVSSQEEFIKYCNDVQRTAAWGSQLEVGTLSHSIIKMLILFFPIIFLTRNDYRFKRSPSGDSLVGRLRWCDLDGPPSLRRGGDEQTTMNGPTIICISIFFFLSLLHVNTYAHTHTKKQPAASLKSSFTAAFRSRAGWRPTSCRRRRIRSFFIVNSIGTSRSPHLPPAHVWLRWTLQQRSASPSRRWRWSELKDKCSSSRLVS